MRRVLTSSGIYVGMVIVFLLLFQEGVSTGLLGMINGRDTTMTSVDLFGMTVFFSSVVLLAPLFCTLPFSNSYCDDMKSNFFYYAVIREKEYRNYVISKLTVSALTGGLTLFFPLFLYGLICQRYAAPFDPMNVEQMSSLGGTIWSVLLKRGGLAYILGQSFFLSLYASAWAMASLAFSSYYPNKYAVYSFPVVICYTFHFLFARLNVGILSPIQSFDPSREVFNNANAPLGYAYMLGYQFLLMIISSGAFYWGIKRRCLRG